MIGREIRKVRIAAGLSQEEVASRARVTREYVSLLERGKYKPTVDVLIRICAATGTKAWKIIRRIER